MRTDSAARQTRFAAILMFKDVAAAHHWLDTANEALTALTPASAQTHEGYLQVLGILNPSGQAA